ncbi:PstS family phosphate ABC transporter substrate-binding protein [Cryptosporangium minutisporangium]|uniref:Substrate-binding domain-containing protein n=1 Tax=Cryptosporangium minutisporangium TaxID=113569 RepID=A0ABP6T5Z3_9ACTN
MLSDIGDNADTILTFLTTIATLVTAAGWLFERVSSRNRKRLNYRVHWNESLTRPEGQPFANDLELKHKNEVVRDPQVVVIRVENTGGSLSARDFDPPLVFGFGTRRVIHAVVAETAPRTLFAGKADDLEAAAATGQTELPLPPVEMRHGDRFKLTVLLNGRHDRVTGSWDRRDARLIEEDKRVRRSRRGLALGGATLALLGLLLGLIIVPSDSKPRTVATIGCHAGTVSISGSTALRPAIETLAAEFEKRCRDTDPDAVPQIVISESGSRTALDTLVRLGTSATNQEIQRTRLVMYDGAAEDPGRVLARHTLGIGIFGIVAHRGAIPDGGLSRAEVRRLWDGRASTFEAVDGADQEVKLISRHPGSGTRDRFERTVLGGRPAAAPQTSSDCTGLDPRPKSDVVHCVRQTTEAVLDVVDALDGAIGYADVRAAARYPDVEVIRLDGYGPSEEDVASEAYPFWAVENLYTFGEPPSGTALKDFLAFVATDEARAILTDKFGYLPCSRFNRSEPARACASK